MEIERWETVTERVTFDKSDGTTFVQEAEGNYASSRVGQTIRVTEVSRTAMTGEEAEITAYGRRVYKNGAESQRFRIWWGIPADIYDRAVAAFDAAKPGA